MTRTLMLTLFAAASTSAFAQNRPFGVTASAGAFEGWNNTPYEHHASNGSSDGGEGFASASANGSIMGAGATAWGGLFSGAMHLGAFTGKPRGGNTNTNYAWASVALWDTVTLYYDGETSARIPLKIQLDGNVKGNGAVHFSYHGWGVNYSSPYGESQEMYSVEDDILLTPLVGSVTFRVSAQANVSSTTWDYDSSGSHADYTHTLKFMWDLPAGVTYTSASGQFNPQPVPEPATMVALGMGAVGLLRRTGRKG